MKAIVKTSRERGIDLLDVPVPVAGDQDILVKVHAAGICGTDVHIYEWSPNYEWVPMPIILGHEFSGEVIEVGERVQGVAAGDRITALPPMPCGNCTFCRMGRGDRCVNRTEVGIVTDGAFAEYVRLTGGAHIFKLPENVGYEAGALCEPLCIALQAVDVSGFKAGQTAAVLGPGPIGLLVVQVLAAMGAAWIAVTGTGSDEKRLAVARALGADATVNVEVEDPVQRVMDKTNEGVDFVFEASGNPKSIAQAVCMLRSKGKVIALGTHPTAASFDITNLVRGKKSIIGSHLSEPDTWPRALGLLSTGRIKAEPIITHRLPLTRAREGFELAAAKEAIKVLLLPQISNMP